MANLLFSALLLAAGLQQSFTQKPGEPDFQDSASAVKYEGPVVYTDLPPPVLYFPTFPDMPRRSGSNDRIQKLDTSKTPIEYIPLPYQDLPVLVYQSKESPPIHVVDKQMNSQINEEYDKNSFQNGAEHTASRPASFHGNSQTYPSVMHDEHKSNGHHKNAVNDGNRYVGVDISALQGQLNAGNHDTGAVRIFQNGQQYVNIGISTGQAQQPNYEYNNNVHDNTRFYSTRMNLQQYPNAATPPVEQQQTSMQNNEKNAPRNVAHHGENMQTFANNELQMQIPNEPAQIYNSKVSGQTNNYGSDNQVYQHILIHIPHALSGGSMMQSQVPRDISSQEHVRGDNGTPYMGTAQVANFIEGANKHTEQHGMGGHDNYNRERPNVDSSQKTNFHNSRYQYDGRQHEHGFRYHQGFRPHQNQGGYLQKQYNNPRNFAEASRVYDTIVSSDFHPQNFPVLNYRKKGATFTDRIIAPNRIRHFFSNENQGAFGSLRNNGVYGYNGYASASRFLRNRPNTALASNLHPQAISIGHPLASFYGSSEVVGVPGKYFSPSSIFLSSSTNSYPLFSHPFHVFPSNLAKISDSTHYGEASSTSVQAVYAQAPSQGKTEFGTRLNAHYDATDKRTKKLTASTSESEPNENEDNHISEDIASPLYNVPHVVYTGHPPIHVFQHPFMIKETTEIPQTGSPETMTSNTNSQNQQNKISIGGIVNFGSENPTYDKHTAQSISSSSFGNSYDVQEQNPNAAFYAHSQGSQNGGATSVTKGNLGSENDDINISYGQYGYAGQTMAIPSTYGYEEIAIYDNGDKLKNMGSLSVSSPYYNQEGYGYVSGIDNVNNGLKNVNKYRGFIDKLAALGSTLFVRSFRPKSSNYYAKYGKDNGPPIDYRSQNIGTSNMDSIYDMTLSSDVTSLNSKSRVSSEEQNPKTSYKVPVKSDIVAPNPRKPPIIIYKGLQPPVHVYGTRESIEKMSDENAEPKSEASPTDEYHSSDNKQSSHLKYYMPLDSNYDSYAVSVPQEYSVAFDSRTAYSGRDGIEYPGDLIMLHGGLDYSNNGPTERIDEGPTDHTKDIISESPAKDTSSNFENVHEEVNHKSVSYFQASPLGITHHNPTASIKVVDDEPATDSKIWHHTEYSKASPVEASRLNPISYSKELLSRSQDEIEHHEPSGYPKIVPMATWFPIDFVNYNEGESKVDDSLVAMSTGNEDEIKIYDDALGKDDLVDQERNQDKFITENEKTIDALQTRPKEEKQP